MTLSNTSLLCFTYLFSSSNMWCMYQYRIHMLIYFGFEIWYSWIWEGFIKKNLWLLPARGDFFFFLFSHEGNGKSCGHMKENCPTFSPSSSFLAPTSLNAFLVLKECLVMSLVFKWPSYVMSALHLFLNDHWFPFVHLNQCSVSSCCLKHFKLGSFAEFSSWWN